MCAASCVLAFKSASENNTEGFVIASVAMFLGAIVFLVNDKYPLFKK
jgi:hypothetical protein